MDFDAALCHGPIISVLFVFSGCLWCLWPVSSLCFPSSASPHLHCITFISPSMFPVLFTAYQLPLEWFKLQFWPHLTTCSFKKKKLSDILGHVLFSFLVFLSVAYLSCFPPCHCSFCAGRLPITTMSNLAFLRLKYLPDGTISMQHFCSSLQDSLSKLHSFNKIRVSMQFFFSSRTHFRVRGPKCCQN